MKLEKILKNPVAVGVLSVCAVLFLFLNNVLPLINKNKEEIPIESAPAETIDASQTITVDSSLGSIKPTELRKIAWKRIGGRDPFKNEYRRDDQKRKIDDTSGDSDTTRFAIRKTDKLAKAPVKPLLKVIAIGPSGKMALIGTRIVHEGDTCSIGIVKKITSDSVVLYGSGGKRVLQFHK